MRPTAAAATPASGITAGLFGIGGPPLASYLLSIVCSNEEYIGMTRTMFAISAFVEMLLRIVCGSIQSSFCQLRFWHDRYFAREACRIKDAEEERQRKHDEIDLDLYDDRSQRSSDYSGKFLIEQKIKMAIENTVFSIAISFIT